MSEDSFPRTEFRPSNSSESCPAVPIVGQTDYAKTMCSDPEIGTHRFFEQPGCRSLECSFEIPTFSGNQEFKSENSCVTIEPEGCPYTAACIIGTCTLLHLCRPLFNHMLSAVAMIYCIGAKQSRKLQFFSQNTGHSNSLSDTFFPFVLAPG